LGWLLPGVPGALIAGGLFLAPSVLVLTTMATAYALWGQLPLLMSVFVVLKPAVLAIVIVAAWRPGLLFESTPISAAIQLSASIRETPCPGAARAHSWRPHAHSRALPLLATPVGAQFAGLGLGHIASDSHSQCHWRLERHPCIIGSLF
jgi:chromate transporter